MTIAMGIVGNYPFALAAEAATGFNRAMILSLENGYRGRWHESPTWQDYTPTATQFSRDSIRLVLKTEQRKSLAEGSLVCESY